MIFVMITETFELMGLTYAGAVIFFPQEKRHNLVATLNKI